MGIQYIRHEWTMLSQATGWSKGPWAGLRKTWSSRAPRALGSSILSSRRFAAWMTWSGKSNCWLDPEFPGFCFFNLITETIWESPNFAMCWDDDRALIWLSLASLISGDDTFSTESPGLALCWTLSQRSQVEGSPCLVGMLGGGIWGALF